jgi:hypothetical protein
VKSDNLEIARFLHLKSEIQNLKLDDPSGRDESNLSGKGFDSERPI